MSHIRPPDPSRPRLTSRSRISYFSVFSESGVPATRTVNRLYGHVDRLDQHYAVSADLAAVDDRMQRSYDPPKIECWAQASPSGRYRETISRSTTQGSELPQPVADRTQMERPQAASGNLDGLRVTSVVITSYRGEECSAHIRQLRQEPPGRAGNHRSGFLAVQKHSVRREVRHSVTRRSV